MLDSSILRSLAECPTADCSAIIDKLSGVSDKCTQVIDNAVFRDANQDFAGTGVISSFVLQGLLTLLFGCIASLVSACIPSDASDNKKDVAARLQSLFIPTWSTAWGLCMITFVAGFVRMTQAPPLFEVAILRDLVEFQSGVMLLAAQAYIAQRCLGHFSGSEMRAVGNDVKVWLMATTQFIAKWPVETKITTILSNSKALSQISEECAKLGRTAGAPSLRERVPSMRTPVGGGWGIFLAAMAFCFLVLLPLAITLVGSSKWPWNTSFFKARATRVTASIILTVLLTFGPVFELVAVFETRSFMLARSDFSNGWGFFQIAAVLVWAPVLMRGLLVLLGLLPFGKIWTSAIAVILMLCFTDDYRLPKHMVDVGGTQQDSTSSRRENLDEKAEERTALLEA